MEMIMAMAIGILAASGTWLILRPRTFQVIIGLALLSYAVNLFIFVSGSLNIAREPVLLRWLLELQLGEETPLLSERNSALAQALRGCDVYHASMQEVSACILGWIVQAQAAGQLRRELPPDVVLCALLARSADPMLAMLRERGYGNAEILAWAMDTCLSGLVPQPAAELRA